MQKTALLGSPPHPPGFTVFLPSLLQCSLSFERSDIDKLLRSEFRTVYLFSAL